MNANIWQPGSTQIQDAMNTIKTQLLLPSAGTETLELTAFEYVMGAGSVLVVKNGEVLAPTVDYTELTPTSIQLTQDSADGDRYLVIGFVRVYDTLEQTTILYEYIRKYQLGGSSTAPTVDLNGDALVAGAWYINTANNNIYVYDGVQWVQSPAVSATVEQQRDTLGVHVRHGTVTFDRTTVASVTLAVTEATTASKIIASVEKKVGDNTYNDELEMDSFTVHARCMTNGQVTFRVHSMFGPATGQYHFNYFVQNP